MESQEISGSELGAIKYVSELLNWDIKRTANLFILILIFVFDPLAITLVIATNQAFKGKRKEEKPEKKIWDRVKKLKEEGKLPPDLTEEEKMDEPTSLAFTPYYDVDDEEETEQVPTEFRPSTDQVTHEPIVVERMPLNLPDIDEKPWKETPEEIEQKETTKRLIYKK
jgi:hypothetical protein